MFGLRRPSSAPSGGPGPKTPPAPLGLSLCSPPPTSLVPLSHCSLGGMRRCPGFSPALQRGQHCPQGCPRPASWDRDRDLGAPGVNPPPCPCTGFIAESVKNAFSSLFCFLFRVLWGFCNKTFSEVFPLLISLQLRVPLPRDLIKVHLELLLFD